jgi:hypothetical protein
MTSSQHVEKREHLQQAAGPGQAIEENIGTPLQAGSKESRYISDSNMQGRTMKATKVFHPEHKVLPCHSKISSPAIPLLTHYFWKLAAAGRRRAFSVLQYLQPLFRFRFLLVPFPVGTGAFL